MGKDDNDILMIFILMAFFLVVFNIGGDVFFKLGDLSFIGKAGTFIFLLVAIIILWRRRRRRGLNF